MELKLGGGVGGNGMVWWPPNFGEAETLVDGGQRRTASRKPFLGGLWLIFCSSITILMMKAHPLNSSAGQRHLPT